MAVKVVYFKNKKTGKIQNHQILPKDWDTHKCHERTDQYNKIHTDFEATLLIVHENSLEAYLVKVADEKIKLQKERVQEALNAIEEAKDLIECLQIT